MSDEENPIVTFRTQYSTYEVDRKNGLVRKVSTNSPVVPHRLETFGAWTPYEDFHVTFGRAFFTWSDGSSTITSEIEP